MDVPKAWIDDENYQLLYFYDTLEECCQKLFHGQDKECEVAVKGGIASFERQADGELEDEVPDEKTEGRLLLPSVCGECSSALW